MRPGCGPGFTKLTKLLFMAYIIAPEQIDNILNNVDNTDLVGDIFYNELTVKQINYFLGWVDSSLKVYNPTTGYGLQLSKSRAIAINVLTCK